MQGKMGCTLVLYVLIYIYINESQSPEIEPVKIPLLMGLHMRLYILIGVMHGSTN